MAIQWKIDECSVYLGMMRIRGWAFAEPIPIESIAVRFRQGGATHVLKSYGLASGDVAKAVHPNAIASRFEETIPVPKDHVGGDFAVVFAFADGTVKEENSGQENARHSDPSHVLWFEFLERLHSLPSGDVVELGSRARSGIIRRTLLPPHLGYVGVDILPGPNVDIVADAHELSAALAKRRFVAVIALSVFEHLAMPWKVVLEINKVLSEGGLVFVQTPQTWPLHDEPWDYWRFSSHAWRCLFNDYTGFKVVKVAHGEPVRVIPLWDAPVLHGLEHSHAFLSSCVLATKVSTSALSWPVPLGAASHGSYPAHITSLPKGSSKTPSSGT